jgi:hypothetical protein
LWSDFVGEIGFDDLGLNSVPISWKGRSKQRPYSAFLRWVLRFGLDLTGVYCPKNEFLEFANSVWSRRAPYDC